jgi:hypothetical protein
MTGTDPVKLTPTRQAALEAAAAGTLTADRYGDGYSIADNGGRPTKATMDYLWRHGLLRRLDGDRNTIVASDEGLALLPDHPEYLGALRSLAITAAERCKARKEDYDRAGAALHAAEVALRDATNRLNAAEKARS